MTTILATPAAACPYFTRDIVERDGIVTRMNTYAAGAWVCHSATMFLCGSDGRWQDKGPCTAYQNWRGMLACRIEGTRGGECDGSRSGEKSGGGSGAGSGKSGSGGSGKGRPGGGGNRAAGGGHGGDTQDPYWDLRPPQSNRAPGPEGGQARAPEDPNSRCRAEQERMERETVEQQARLQGGGASICQQVVAIEQQLRGYEQLLIRCPNSDPTGEKRRQIDSTRDWASKARAQSCRP